MRVSGWGGERFLIIMGAICSGLERGREFSRSSQESETSFFLSSFLTSLLRSSSPNDLRRRAQLQQLKPILIVLICPRVFPLFHGVCPPPIRPSPPLFPVLGRFSAGSLSLSSRPLLRNPLMPLVVFPFFLFSSLFCAVSPISRFELSSLP